MRNVGGRSARCGRSRRKVLAAVLLSGVLVGIAAAPATAGTAYGSWGGYSAGGVSYQNRAYIYTTSGQARAYTQAGPTSTTVASGWVGARGRLFTSGGALSCEGVNDYSTISLTAGATWSGLSCLRSATGAWYSYGVSLGWNGSGYNSVYTFLSPNQNS